MCTWNKKGTIEKERIYASIKYIRMCVLKSIVSKDHDFITRDQGAPFFIQKPCINTDKSY